LLPEARIQPLSLGELATRYLAFVAHQRALSTKRIHFAHFRRILGNPPIHSLTVETLDLYRSKRREQDGVGPATINREVGTLKNALTKAVEWKLLRKSAREELAAVKKFQEPDGRLRYLCGPPEAQRLTDACEPWLRPIVVTTLHTGMRKGEVLGLTWELVDLDHGFIGLKRTKNGKARALPFK
jgi:integrase